MARDGCAAIEKIYKELASAKQLPQGVNAEGKSNSGLLRRRFSIIDCLKELKDHEQARKVLAGMQSDLNESLGEKAKDHPLQSLINQADVGLCLREKTQNHGEMSDELRKRCEALVDQNEAIAIKVNAPDSIHLVNQLHSNYLNKISLGSVKDMASAVAEIKKITPLVAKFHNDENELNNQYVFEAKLLLATLLDSGDTLNESRRIETMASQSRLYQYVLNYQRKYVGGNEIHPYLEQTYINIGIFNRTLKRYNEAERMFRLAEALQRAVYGDTHEVLVYTLK